MPVELKTNSGKVTLTSPTIVSGGGGYVDLSNYYTKPEVDALIPDVSGFITDDELDEIIDNYVSKNDLDGYVRTEDISGFMTEVPEEYVTDEELNAKGYLTEHQSLDGYAKTSDIPDVSGFQTEAQVNALIDAKLPPSAEEVAY